MAPRAVLTSQEPSEECQHCVKLGDRYFVEQKGLGSWKKERRREELNGMGGLAPVG